jgi:flagellar export protein FliJ
MARFIFTLQPVLEHRERLEQQRQLALAAALKKQHDAEAVYADLTGRRDAVRRRLRLEHAGMMVDELRAAYAHCDYLDRAIAAQDKVVAQARIFAGHERAKLIAASKDKQVLDTLKTRRRETFESEAATVEQRQLDDLNARAYERVQALRESNP